MESMKKLGILVAGALVLAGCNASINSSIHVADGESRSGGMTSVNGNLEVGKDCEVGGASKTVNGTMEIGDRSRVEDLATVNGSIRLREGVNVRGDIESVNGSVGVGSGSEISGDVTTVNGSIELTQTKIQQDVRTVNGDIDLLDQTVVEGDVVIEGKFAGDARKRPIEIVIAGSTVEGSVRVKRKVDVRVILRDGGKVLGSIDGAEVVDENAAEAASGNV